MQLFWSTRSNLALRLEVWGYFLHADLNKKQQSIPHWWSAAPRSVAQPCCLQQAMRQRRNVTFLWSEASTTMSMLLLFLHPRNYSCSISYRKDRLPSQWSPLASSIQSCMDFLQVCWMASLEMRLLSGASLQALKVHATQWPAASGTDKNKECNKHPQDA